MRREKTFVSLFDVFNGLLMIVVCAIMIYPFIYVFSLSVSDPAFVETGKVTFLPIGFNLHAYDMYLRQTDVVRAYFNTVVYAVSGTAVTLLLTSLTAYPMAVKNFYGRSVFMFIFAFTMFFNGGMIPTFILVRNLHMINTIWAVIIPSALSAWNLIIFITFFKEIPESLSESATIDGANDWLILFRIILPLSKPVFATVGLFSIVGHWNSFLGPFLYLNDKEKFPLQLALRKMFDVQYRIGTESFLPKDVQTPLVSYRCAAIFLSVLPIVCTYPFLQKYFIKGVMIGSLKG